MGNVFSKRIHLLFLKVCVCVCVCNFFNGHNRGIWNFPGLGLHLSPSCDLLHICSSAGYFKPLH